MIKNLIKPVKGQKHWITAIKKLIYEDNNNFIGFISGPTGSGKSYSTLSICEDLDPDFNVDRIVFNAIDLMKLINSNVLKKGSAIAFEETGVEMSSKKWQSITNKMINYLLQTFRHRNFILLMNSPYMDFVDNTTVKLFDVEFTTEGILKQTNEVRLKPLILQWNSHKKKFYRKRLRLITGRGYAPINIWKVHKPSKELIGPYEIKKLEFTKALNKKIEKELREYENSKNDKKRLTEVQETTLNLLKDGLSIEQVAITRGVTPIAIEQTIRLIKLKGIALKPSKNDENGRTYEVID